MNDGFPTDPEGDKGKGDDHSADPFSEHFDWDLIIPDPEPASSVDEDLPESVDEDFAHEAGEADWPDERRGGDDSAESDEVPDAWEADDGDGRENGDEVGWDDSPTVSAPGGDRTRPEWVVEVESVAGGGPVEGIEWGFLPPAEERGPRGFVADLERIENEAEHEHEHEHEHEPEPEPEPDGDPWGEPVRVVAVTPPRPKAKRYLADAAWLGGEALARKVLLEVVDGRFTVVDPASKAKDAKRLKGIVLPGLVNTHSHAFHRLLRGRTHRQGGDFWSWRDRMFEAAVSLDPDSYEEVATAVFVEMAMAGITTVGEFHYLHHRIGGVPYSDPNEMSHAMVRAASRAGIRIGLLDAGYFTDGIGKPTLHPVQERFSDGSVEAWLARVALLAAAYSGDDRVRIGVAPHSVRAVPFDGLRQLGDRVEPGMPVHMHVSEQPAENLACLGAHGVTPVGLLDRVGLLGANMTVVHATHLTDDDISVLGSSRTGVCLCPTTERDLADGIGPSRALLTAGSSISVGSDSQAVIDLFEEARGVELHHRLAAGRRGGFAPATLLEAATCNGATALGFARVGIEVGAPADFIRLDRRSPRLAGLPARAESVVFSAVAADVEEVFVGGKRIVSDGAHREWKAAHKTFKART